MLWELWWVWLAAGVGLGILEILAPGYVFLGFAIGASAVGGLLALGFGGGLPMLLVIFAVLSLVSWFALRKIFGIRQGQVKVWDRDINDD